MDDLNRIQDRLLSLTTVKSALSVTDSILDRIEILGEYPDSGSYTPDGFLNKMGYRKLVCSKQYVAIYRHIGNEVFIYHIADTRTDYPSLF